MKTPKFLICENPMTAANDGRLFVLHSRDPIILAEVVHFEDMNEEDRMNYERSITSSANARLDYPPETIFFHALWLLEGGKFQMKTAQEQVDEVASIMRRMADWYKKYLIFEDNEN